MSKWEAEFAFPCAFCTEVAGGGMISGTLHKGTPMCSACGAIAQVEWEAEPSKAKLAKKVLGQDVFARQAVSGEELEPLVEFKVGEAKSKDQTPGDARRHGWEVLWARRRAAPQRVRRQ